MSKANPSSRRQFFTAAGAAGAVGLTAGSSHAEIKPRHNNRIEPPTAKGTNVGQSQNVVAPPFAVMVLNKMGFGPARRVEVSGASAPNPDVILESSFETRTSPFATQDDVAHFIALGSNDDERLANYVDEQLDPNLDDSVFEAQFAAYQNNYSTLSEFLSQTFNQRECADFSTYDRPRREVEMAAFFRAIYSRRQLFELMADFWHNHFNVFAGDDRDTRVAWASWDKDIIRRHVFGNFYKMVIRSAQHVCMSRYLDNYVNGVNGINENYCRELFELHCMGAEHYQGNARQRDVEVLPENPYTALNDAELNNPALGFLADPTLDIARFYVDDDVLEAAQAMSGWRYEDLSNADPGGCGSGLFITDEDDHISDATKAVLTAGVAAIPSNLDAETEGRLVCKLTAYHPSTAIYVARKLCTRLISDDPPQSIVDAAAATFFANRLSEDQIGLTLRTILLSDEFKDLANAGSKVKRPFEYVVSVMRAGGCQHDLRPDDDASEDFLNTYDNTGQELFTWRTPDGFPDFRSHWQSAANMVQCWRTVDFLFDRDYLDTDRFMRAINITLDNLSGDSTPREIVEFWCNWLFGFTPAGTWVGPVGTLFQNAPTTVGSAALQFMTQQGFGSERDAEIYPADELIARNDLRFNEFPFYWHQRLIGMIKLLAWSPQMMQR